MSELDAPLAMVSSVGEVVVDVVLCGVSSPGEVTVNEGMGRGALGARLVVGGAGAGSRVPPGGAGDSCWSGLVVLDGSFGGMKLL